MRFPINMASPIFSFAKRKLLQEYLPLSDENVFFGSPSCKKIEFYGVKTGKIAPNMIL